jgi:hypothetical protein
LIEQVLHRLPNAPVDDLDSLMQQDQLARAEARALLN